MGPISKNKTTLDCGCILRKAKKGAWIITPCASHQKEPPALSCPECGGTRGGLTNSCFCQEMYDTSR